MNLYDWIFHFNPYTNKWNAVKRDDYNDLFNGKLDSVISSSNINTLTELIEKTDGDKDKILKLLNK